MLTNLFIWLGWSRDDLKWFWVQLVAGVVAAAGLVADNLIDLPYWVTYLGLPIGERGIHWIVFSAGAITWIAARAKRSSLPSGAAMASGVVAGSPASKVGVVLLACVLGAGAAFTAPGCAATRPPAGTYTQPVQQAWDAGHLIEALTALSQTARNLNATTGGRHLKDSDTAHVHDFTLLAGAFLYAYGQGATTLEAARAVINGLTLEPGIAAAARAAFDRGVMDYGAGASVLRLVSDAYSAFVSHLSIDGAQHPQLVALLNTVALAMNQIPGK